MPKCAQNVLAKFLKQDEHKTIISESSSLWYSELLLDSLDNNFRPVVGHSLLIPKLTDHTVSLRYHPHPVFHCFLAFDGSDYSFCCSSINPIVLKGLVAGGRLNSSLKFNAHHSSINH